MRHRTRGAGKWVESTGDRSKFGLTTAEIVASVDRLREIGMLDCLQLLHFHIGSQITAIRAIKDALREASRIYVELVLLGANTGGGKTAFQLTCMANMARMGTSVAMLQLELSLDQMNERLSAHFARIDSNLIRAGNLDEEHHIKIREAWDEFHEECCDAKSRSTTFS